MKKISVVTSCLNEEENLREFHRRVTAALHETPQYDYEIIIADNHSTDHSRDVIRELAQEDPHLKAIFNAANFGHIRSPYHAMMQAQGDAVICLCSDLQEPPELIPTFIKKWEEGAKIVCGVKPKSKENPLMFAIRRFYYRMIASLSETPQIQNFTGFGLYDRKVIDALKLFHEPYPYFRGLIAEVGFSRVEVPFIQAERTQGKTKNNFITLYDMAMTGFVNHTKLPLRMATFTGFFLAALSILIAFGYFLYKLFNWDNFQLGLAPLIIGLFFFASVQLVFIGIIGEYIGAIWTQVKNKPLVIEEERIHFE